MTKCPQKKLKIKKQQTMGLSKFRKQFFNFNFFWGHFVTKTSLLFLNQFKILDLAEISWNRIVKKILELKTCENTRRIEPVSSKILLELIRTDRIAKLLVLSYVHQENKYPIVYTSLYFLIPSFTLLVPKKSFFIKIPYTGICSPLMDKFMNPH